MMFIPPDDYPIADHFSLKVLESRKRIVGGRQMLEQVSGERRLTAAVPGRAAVCP